MQKAVKVFGEVLGKPAAARGVDKILHHEGHEEHEGKRRRHEGLQGKPWGLSCLISSSKIFHHGGD